MNHAFWEKKDVQEQVSKDSSKSSPLLVRRIWLSTTSCAGNIFRGIYLKLKKLQGLLCFVSLLFISVCKGPKSWSTVLEMRLQRVMFLQMRNAPPYSSSSVHGNIHSFTTITQESASVCRELGNLYVISKELLLLCVKAHPFSKTFLSPF